MLRFLMQAGDILQCLATSGDAICPITERDTIKPVPGNDPVSRLAVHLSMSQNWDKRIKCDPVSENL